MPLQKLQFRPGINKEGTNYSNEGGWFECDKVRFRSGFPEKLGGWARATAGNFYKGVCRALISWVDLSNNKLIGIGTHLKYYLNQSLGIYHDITPIVFSSNPDLSNPFETTAGSRVIVVTDAQNPTNPGNYVTFSGATGFNGLTANDLNAEFEITNVRNVTTYEITLPVGVTPNASGFGGGTTVVADYQLDIGLPATTPGNGFGAGVWNGANLSTYSTALVYTSGLQSHGDLLNNVSTTINVTSTFDFPASGTILINAELITYSGKTPTSFTGCVRGHLDSNAVYHNTRPGTNTPVLVYNVTDYFGTTGWGNPTAGAGVGIDQQLRLWTHDNFGENLLIAPRGGQIYYWINDTSTWPRAVALSTTSPAPYQTDVPIIGTLQVIVSDVSRFVIAMGCNTYNPADPYELDPMLVRWSDQEDPLVWTPTATTQAGEQRLSNGSYIVQARKTRQEILIWTDSALYSMQYLGPPYIWGFQLLMDNISIISPNAAITVNNVSYWMGVDKFYSYSGRVETLPCSVWQYIYEDISPNQQAQVFAGTNEGYNEVWWFYVSNAEVDAAVEEARAPIIDKYVIYNYLERLWYYGSLRRTFWLDSPLFATPLSAVCGSTNENATVLDPTRTNVNTGTLLFQESTNDDNSTATSRPISAYIQSSDFDIGDGHNFGFVWRILPDINFNGSSQANPTVTMTVRPRQNSGRPYGFADSPSVVSANNYGPTIKQYPIQEFTGQVYTRLRGRQMAFKIESGGQLGVAWQLGSPRIDIRNDGRR